MAKKISGYIKLQVPAGKANPAPPIGPALGQHGVNIMEFCKAFNVKTAQMDPDMKIPVVITVYADRSFTFETKTPPAADLLKKAAGISSGSGRPNKEKVGKISRAKVEEIVKTLKQIAFAKFDETVELTIWLGVDPRKADQLVRGTLVLPHGLGRSKTVLVIAQGDKVREAEEAGADLVGGEDMVNKIKGGWLEFDAVIATPDMMRLVGGLGKVLGPRGLMPNPKTGTVTFDVKTAVKETKAGKVEYRVDKTGVIHTAVGKISFDENKLRDNTKALLDAVVKAKPATAKGKYVKKVNLASTMSPGVLIDEGAYVK